MRRSGTTSAYAENTNQGPGHGHRGGNYLRVRGEYRIKAERERKLAELPPRTRRIHVGCAGELNDFGTTSAYAENTSGMPGRNRRGRNYLRVRGEYNAGDMRSIVLRELPPRTRRILVTPVEIVDFQGTTSAYAENTDWLGCAQSSPRNYLRVRGEYQAAGMATKIGGELPPRTRRIRVPVRRIFNHYGTTSAYAENTPPIRHRNQLTRNYLRVRGEYPIR